NGAATVCGVWRMFICRVPPNWLRAPHPDPLPASGAREDRAALVQAKPVCCLPLLSVGVPNVVDGLPGPVLLLLPRGHILSLLVDLFAVGCLERGFVGAGGIAETAAYLGVKGLPGDREGLVGEVPGPDLLGGGPADGHRFIRRIG